MSGFFKAARNHTDYTGAEFCDTKIAAKNNSLLPTEGLTYKQTEPSYSVMEQIYSAQRVNLTKEFSKKIFLDYHNSLNNTDKAAVIFEVVLRSEEFHNDHVSATCKVKATNPKGGLIYEGLIDSNYNVSNHQLESGEHLSYGRYMPER